jgi:hypothetical protein
MLYNLITRYYDIGEHKKVNFTNRVAAVAAAILYTGGKARYTTEFLPDTDDYVMFRQALDAACRLRLRTGDHNSLPQVQNFKNAARNLNPEDINAQEFLAVLVGFMNALRAISADPNLGPPQLRLEDFAAWPGRCIVDILEGYMECEKSLGNL